MKKVIVRWLDQKDNRHSLEVFKKNFEELKKGILLNGGLILSVQSVK